MVMPELFGAAEMSFKKAFGLTLLYGVVTVVLRSDVFRRRVKPGRRMDVPQWRA
jgi:hypothetical protein